MRINRLKQSLRDGHVQVGTWIHTLGMPQLPPLLATAGFDYVFIDMEHSCLTIEAVGNLCLVAQHVGLTPLVRPPGHEHHLLSRPVDNGAMGVLMPHVDGPEQALMAVRAVKFPPMGERGSQPPNANADFAPVDAAEYMAWSNRESMIMVQIESRKALRNLDAILAVPGVDGAVVGRGDLSAELGVGGRRDHPEVLAAVEALIAACERHGRFPGLLVQQVEEAKDWIRKGIRMVTYAGATTILRNAATDAVRGIRSAI